MKRLPGNSWGEILSRLGSSAACLDRERLSIRVNFAPEIDYRQPTKPLDGYSRTVY